MKAFIPVTDELLFAPDAPKEKLVPYQVGLPCYHWAADLRDHAPFRAQPAVDHPSPRQAASPSRR